jgi:hypothetical protein
MGIILPRQGLIDIADGRDIADSRTDCIEGQYLRYTAEDGTYR